MSLSTNSAVLLTAFKTPVTPHPLCFEYLVDFFLADKEALYTALRLDNTGIDVKHTVRSKQFEKFFVSIFRLFYANLMLTLCQNAIAKSVSFLTMFKRLQNW